jgi:hypothetical protein
MEENASSGEPVAPQQPGSDKALRWQPLVLVGRGILLLLVLIAGGTFYLGRSRGQPGPSNSAAFPPTPTPIPVVKPQPIRLQPQGATPVVVTAAPTPPNWAKELFANPTEPAYIPGKGFTPDAQRIVDLSALQLSIEQYRKANGRFPPTLADLFPSFAPADVNGQPLAAPPVDPVTRQPYTYLVASDGSNYQLSATLESGRQYTLTHWGQ